MIISHGIIFKSCSALKLRIAKVYLFTMKCLQVQKLGEYHEIILLLPISATMHSNLKFIKENFFFCTKRLRIIIFLDYAFAPGYLSQKFASSCLANAFFLRPSQWLSLTGHILVYVQKQEDCWLHPTLNMISPQGGRGPALCSQPQEALEY